MLGAIFITNITAVHIYLAKSLIMLLFIQWKLPIVDNPNSGHALNSGQKI